MTWLIEEFWLPIIVALIVAALTGMFKKWPKIKRWIAARDLPPGEDTHFTILVAELEHDDERRSQTEHVLQSFRKHFASHSEARAFRVIDVPKIQAAGLAGDLAEKDRKSEQQGQKLLSQKKGDILVWGQVADNNKVLRLRFLLRDRPGSTPSSYQLNDSLELEANFAKDMGEALTAVVLAAAAPAFSPTHPIAKLLGPLLPKLKNIVDHGRDTLPRTNYASMCNSAGVAFAVFGEQSGLPQWLSDSVTTFNKALTIYAHQGMPDHRAAVQNNLGTVLGRLGAKAEGEAAQEFLEKSLIAYEEALKVYTRADMPAHWAAVQNNLGTVLSTLGARAEGETAQEFLEKSLLAYEEALKVYTRADMPAQWAMTQNNLGVAHRILSQRAGGWAALEHLQKSVAAHEAALTVYTRADMPAQWAMTQNNLGTVLCILGDRGKGRAALEHLQKSVAAHKAALTVYTRADTPALWAMTQNNLGTVLCILGQRGESKAALEQSVAAHGAALTVYTRANMPAPWAMTQNNLVNVLLTLGEIAEGEEIVMYRVQKSAVAYEAAQSAGTQNNLGTVPRIMGTVLLIMGTVLRILGTRAEGKAALKHLRSSVAAYEAALTVFTRAGIPAPWAITQNNLGTVLCILGERAKGKSSLKYLQKSLAAFDAALEVFASSGMQYHAERTRRNRSKAKALLAGRSRA